MSSTVRLKLTIAYDGRGFEGWQSQPSRHTIQDTLEAALAEIAGRPLRLHGSGRTDAGVHALAQVAHFDPPENGRMRPSDWLRALNSKLPPAIRITAAEHVPTDFHARFSATAKIYRYQIVTTPVLSPFLHGLAWHVTREIDFTLLTAALAGFRGFHNFLAFSARRGNETADTDYHRTLARAEVERTTDGFSLTFEGDGFLYKMVRLLTGSAIHVATGRMKVVELHALLDQPDPAHAIRSSFCAPAAGLYLAEVCYPAAQRPV